jgi:hypothetical protein
MDRIFSSISRLLEKATFSRVFSVGLLILFAISGYIGYKQADVLGSFFFAKGAPPPFISIPIESEQAVAIFMRKHKEVVYLTVFTFKFESNTRLPIYSSFNSDELKKIIIDRLNAGDGALPIFIKNDTSNNNQMISIVTGENACDPFTAGGTARVWPDLASKLTMSCRVPVPPVFGNQIRGYIVAHVTQRLTTYELEVLKLDLVLLAASIHEHTKK